LVDSYAKRIEMAERELADARARRDLCYPGSPEWEREVVKVMEWERAIEDLRRAETAP
jgi:hypothetical protein